MITDIVPLTISATTMFVQVQMVGEIACFMRFTQQRRGFD